MIELPSVLILRELSGLFLFAKSTSCCTEDCISKRCRASNKKYPVCRLADEVRVRELDAAIEVRELTLDVASRRPLEVSQLLRPVDSRSSEESLEEADATLPVAIQRDPGVLPADLASVLVVFLWLAAEDGEIDVTDDSCGGGSGATLVGCRHDESLNLVDRFLRAAERGENLSGELRTPLFVVAGSRIVVCIVEPEGELDRVRISVGAVDRRSGAQGVEDPQTLTDVLESVVVPPWLLVLIAYQLVRSHRRCVGLVPAPEELPPPVSQVHRTSFAFGKFKKPPYPSDLAMTCQ